MPVMKHSSSCLTGIHNIQPRFWTSNNLLSEVRCLKFWFIFFCLLFTSPFMLCNCSSSLSVCVCVSTPKHLWKQMVSSCQSVCLISSGETVTLHMIVCLFLTSKPRRLTLNPFNMHLDRLMTRFRQIILHFSKSEGHFLHINGKKVQKDQRLDDIKI